MSAADISELKRAYSLLDVPCSASARSIKQAYRRIAKRWHPDRYQAGTPAHAEATQMMKCINEAYALIENAPLLCRPAKSAATTNSPSSEPSNYADPETGHFWSSFFDVVSSSPVLMRIVLFPVGVVVLWPIMMLFDNFPPWPGGLDRE